MHDASRFVLAGPVANGHARRGNGLTIKTLCSCDEESHPGAEIKIDAALNWSWWKSNSISYQRWLSTLAAQLVIWWKESFRALTRPVTNWHVCFFFFITKLNSIHSLLHHSFRHLIKEFNQRIRKDKDDRQLGSGFFMEHPHCLIFFAWIHPPLCEKKRKKTITGCVSTQDRWESVSREKNKRREQTGD